MVPKINLISSSVLLLRPTVVADARGCDCDGGGGGDVADKEDVRSGGWDWAPLDEVVDAAFGSQFLR